MPPLTSTDETWTPATFVVGVHGILRLHPWVLQRQERGTFELDTYSLMATRGTALGLTEFASEENQLARWRQEEAGQDWTQDDTARQVAWMQAEAVNLDKQRIPVWMALTCLYDSTTKIGELEITGTHAVLPLHWSTPAPRRLLNATDWFSLRDSVPRYYFTISLYTTRTGTTFDNAALTEKFRTLTSEILSSETVGEAPAGTPQPSELEGCWLLGKNVTAHHIRCQSTEWSLDMAALATDAAAYAAQASGVDRPTLVAVFRHDR